jgi:hypothetical protein
MMHAVVRAASMLLITVSVIACLCAPARAQLPQALNYQGILVDASGQPLNVVSQSITFKLYDALNNGTLLYTELHPSVAVNNGVFNVVIGSLTPLALPFDIPYWLELQVGAETLAPRQPLASAAYALRSGCNPGDRVECFDSPTGAPGVNNCQLGTRTCNAQGTGWSACAGEVTPCGGGATCCAAPQTCGGGGIPNQCGCTPKSCFAQGFNCGPSPDGCGGTIPTCGTCTLPQTCGGGGPHRCG